MNAEMQAGRFGVSGKGVKLGESSTGGALYLHRR